HRDLHSFPTRRSSDLVPQTVVAKSFINHAAIEQWTFFCRKFFFSRPEAWLLGVSCLIGVGVAFRRRTDLIPIFVWGGAYVAAFRSEEHTSELQSPCNL